MRYLEFDKAIRLQV